MRDNNMLFRSTTASITSTETSSSLDIGPTPHQGLDWVVSIPKKSVGDTIQAQLYHSTDDSTFTLLLSMETVASVTQASTTPFQLKRRFSTECRYLREELVVAGTSPDFGAVKSWVTFGDPRQNRGGGFVTSNP